MAQRALKSVDGDRGVVAHPSFRRIPKCLFKLSSDDAEREYDRLARAFFERGRLTLGLHGDLSSYAKQMDIISSADPERPMRASWFTNLDKLRAKLKLDDIDKPIAASENAPVNKFSRAGFSARR